MTASERNLWRMAELAVKNNNVDEVFKDIMEKCDLKTMQLFMLYVGLNRSVNYGSRKDCESYIRLESPGYLHPKFRLEPYNEADWSNTETCVITARDFKSLKAAEQLKYLKLSYDKRKLVREMVK